MVRGSRHQFPCQLSPGIFKSLRLKVLGTSTIEYRPGTEFCTFEKSTRVAAGLAAVHERNLVHRQTTARGRRRRWNRKRNARSSFGNGTEVDRLASDLIELFTRESLAYWLAPGTIFRGWARSVSGDLSEGIAWMEQGIRDYCAIGSVLAVPQYLGLKAEALHLADRTSEALEAISEAEALAEKFAQRAYLAELYRLRGVFLAATGLCLAFRSDSVVRIWGRAGSRPSCRDTSRAARNAHPHALDCHNRSCHCGRRSIISCRPISVFASRFHFYICNAVSAIDNGPVAALSDAKRLTSVGWRS